MFFPRKIKVSRTIFRWEAKLSFTILLLCCMTPCYAFDIVLEWNGNTEQDLLGYRVYYKTGSPGPPYRGTGAWEGESPIEVNADDVTMGNICMFTLTGLEDTQVYYFVVTAHDERSFESGYSNEVCFIYLPREPAIHQVIPNRTPPSRSGNPQYVETRGLGFGQTQCTSTLHIGNKTWSAGYPKIKVWQDDKIKFKVPKYGPPLPKYKDIWVTVNGKDSNKVQLKITAP